MDGHGSEIDLNPPNSPVRKIKPMEVCPFVSKETSMETEVHPLIVVCQGGRGRFS